MKKSKLLESGIIMSASKSLLNEETVTAYMKRARDMQKHVSTEKGDDLFIVKWVVISEQVNNLHVKAKIREFEVDNDGPSELGGNNKGLCPLECLLATIANCLEQTALLYFTFMKVKLKSVKVKVEASHDVRSSLNPYESPFPGLYDFKITWFIDSNDDLKKIKRVLEKVKAICPVKGTVSRTHDFQDEITLLGNNNSEN